MIISIASGKGGTGKTTVAVNLALSLNNVQLLDCDVEEPNVGLFLKPKILTTEDANVSMPVFDKGKCTFCGECSKACAYNAIAVFPTNLAFFEHMCHGCGACIFVCKHGAIIEKPHKIGEMITGISGNIEFYEGRINSGEILSPVLIKQLKTKIDKTKMVIIDSPPGTSCQFVSAVTGSDYCILVAEPTPFGINDLLLAIDSLGILGIPYGLVINRSDIGSNDLKELCDQRGINVLMEIPYDQKIAKLYSDGEMFLDKMPEYKEKFMAMIEKLLKAVKK